MAIGAQTSGNNTLVTVLAVIIVAIVAVAVIYLMQDHRTSSERVGDAIKTIPQGVGKAADKLDDQPPAQNVERNIDKAVN